MPLRSFRTWHIAAAPSESTSAHTRATAAAAAHEREHGRRADGRRPGCSGHLARMQRAQPANVKVSSGCTRTEPAQQCHRCARARKREPWPSRRAQPLLTHTRSCPARVPGHPLTLASMCANAPAALGAARGHGPGRTRDGRTPTRSRARARARPAGGKGTGWVPGARRPALSPAARRKLVCDGAPLC